MAEVSVARRGCGFLFSIVGVVLIAGLFESCEGCTDKYQDRDGMAVRYAGRIVVTGVDPATDQGFVGNRLTYDGDWKKQKVVRYREMVPFASVGDLTTVDRRHLEGVVSSLSYDTSRYSLMVGDTLQVQISPAITAIPFAALLSGGNRHRGFFIEQITNIDSVYRKGGRDGRAVPMSNRVHSWASDNGTTILIVIAVLVGMALLLAFRKRGAKGIE